MAARKNRAGDFIAQAKAAGRREKVDVPGMDMDVYAVTLTHGAVRRITEACLKDGRKPDEADAYDEDMLTQMMVSASIVDGDGERLIPEGRESEIEDLPNPIQLALQSAALRVNGMGAAAGNAAS